MKKAFTIILATIVALALAAVLQDASAASVMALENDDGGRIELTTTVIPDEARFGACVGLFLARAWGRNGVTLGCWSPEMDTRTVRVIWFPAGYAPVVRIYDMTHFRRLP